MIKIALQSPKLRSFLFPSFTPPLGGARASSHNWSTSAETRNDENTLIIHDKIVTEIGEDKPIITLAHGPDFGVIRATDAVNEMFGFNINDIIPIIAVKVPQSGLDGGGHECAGSLKYVEGLSNDVLNEFAQQVKNMEKKDN